MIAIRPATTSDADAEIVGRLLLDAFPKTFTYIFGERDRQAARAVGHGLRAFGSMPNARLAGDGATFVGVVLLRWDNRATPAAGLRALLAMARVLGPWRALRVAVHIPPLPPHWLHAHEAYISALAVVPWQRGRGYGSALIDHAVKLARSRGFHQMTLRVEADNTAAYALFHKHGFAADRRRFQWFFDLVRRHFGEVVMTRWLD